MGADARSTCSEAHYLQYLQHEWSPTPPKIPLLGFPGLPPAPAPGLPGRGPAPPGNSRGAQGIKQSKQKSNHNSTTGMAWHGMAASLNTQVGLRMNLACGACKQSLRGKDHAKLQGRIAKIPQTVYPKSKFATHGKARRTTESQLLQNTSSSPPCACKARHSSRRRRALQSRDVSKNPSQALEQEVELRCSAKVSQTNPKSIQSS